MQASMVELTAEEQRVLGALIEKQYVTPDAYPLTMNGLLAAANQVSNRNPVVSFDEATVHRALDSLREKGLTRIVYSPSNRATKYRQVLEEAEALEPPEMAVLCVLLLRGPQTVGELRTRSERIHAFATLGEVEETLARLGASRARGAMVARQERQAGQKEARYTHLLGDSAALPESPPESPPVSPPAPAARPGLDDEVRQLRADLDALRAEFDALRAELT
jgi:uncharacterized protein YceH (UPF0502 family)